MNLSEILTEEPELKPLIVDAVRIGKSTMTSGNKDRYWYHVLKPQMKRMVGFMAENQKLTSSDHYDFIYQHLIKLMGI